MKQIIRSAAAGVFGLAALLSTAGAGLALPPSSQGGGKTYCQCSCRTSNNIKDLDWEMGPGGCNSNGKGCKATFDGGKTFQNGKLGDCSTCKAEPPGSGWLCKPSGAMSTTPGTRVPPANVPGGTLQKR